MNMSSIFMWLLRRVFMEGVEISRAEGLLGRAIKGPTNLVG
jgi:hypothetical protein